MLERLRIENYVLIDSLDISLHRGFSVITGETGAGKSILLGALGMLLGHKTDAKVIKQGERKCMVEATFRIDNADMLSPFFEKNDLDFDGDECIVRREISLSGKSRAFINDTPVNLSTLKELGEQLIDIHSQHKNLLLNESEFKITLLDIVAQNETAAEIYRNLYKKFKETEVRLLDMENKLEQAQKERDYMQFQLGQLMESHLVEGEQESLEQEASTLSHVEEIKQIYFELDNLLNGNATNLIDGMRSCCSYLQRLQNIAPQTGALSERMDSLYVDLKDIAREILSNAESVDYDPHRLKEVETRLNSLYELQRKHRVGSVTELIAIQQRLEQELHDIETCDDDIQRLKREREMLYKEVLQRAKELSNRRKEAAKIIEKKMAEHLQPLGMPHVQFSFCFDTCDNPGLHGTDKVTILFSSNKNVPLQDLSQIASGGEIARVMLSLKALISQNMQMPTLVFDEIDTGVSGSIAEKMAHLMQQIAQGSRQVISITHLPQIAALGKHHYRVYKKEEEDRTTSYISELTPEERVQEIANMLSGSELTQAAITNAKELLKQSLRI